MMEEGTCNFIDKLGRCTIGCRSMGVAYGDTCPYTATTDKDKSCPCHQDSLTFALAKMVNKIIKKHLEEV